MAIVSEKNEMLAVRRPLYSGFHVFNLLNSLPVYHAPSMFRRDAVDGVAYDENFLLAQDMDFLRRLLWQKKFYVSEKILYVYDEIRSVSLKKILRAYYYNARGYMKFFGRAPIRSLFLAAKEVLKIFYIMLKSLTVNRERVLLARSLPPEEFEQKGFLFAKACALGCDSLTQVSSGMAK